MPSHSPYTAAFSAVRVYHSGDPIANISTLTGLVTGGTPDAAVVSWAARAIRKATPRDVQPVLIVASDGEGSLSSAVHLGDTTFVSDLARKYQVQIVSVAIGDINETFQETAYGPKGYIGWKGSIAQAARPLGDLVARIASR